MVHEYLYKIYFSYEIISVGFSVVLKTLGALLLNQFIQIKKVQRGKEQDIEFDFPEGWKNCRGTMILSEFS